MILTGILTQINWQWYIPLLTINAYFWQWYLLKWAMRVIESRGLRVQFDWKLMAGVGLRWTYLRWTYSPTLDERIGRVPKRGRESIGCHWQHLVLATLTSRNINFKFQYGSGNTQSCDSTLFFSFCGSATQVCGGTTWRAALQVQQERT